MLKWSEVTQSCPTLCDPMDCSLQGSSVHGIFQARVLEWVAISFSRGSSRPRDRTWVSHIAGRRFTVWATREAILSVKEPQTASGYHTEQGRILHHCSRFYWTALNSENSSVEILYSMSRKKPPWIRGTLKCESSVRGMASPLRKVSPQEKKRNHLSLEKKPVQLLKTWWILQHSI